MPTIDLNTLQNRGEEKNEVMGHQSFYQETYSRTSNRMQLGDGEECGMSRLSMTNDHRGE
jgi:hypothetical protein